MDQNRHELSFLGLKKNLKKDFSGLKTFRLALLGDSSTQLLHQAIRGYGYETGLNIEVYESDYAQIDPEIYNRSSRLYSFTPDAVLLFHSTQKQLSLFYACSEKEKNSFATDQLSHFRDLVNKLQEHIRAKILFSNFIEINDAVFGNYGNKISSSFLFQLRKLNVGLMDWVAANKDLFINDLSSLNNRVGLSHSFDPKLYVNSDLVFSLDFTAMAAKNVVDIILPITGRMKKCLILDLDNTLWGGIIGDDGMENIQIGDLGIGKAFTQVQKWAQQLKQRGIILAIASKNTESVAKEPFADHPDMILRLEDISVFVANWENKADNIRYIQSILNIGFDSMVFVDDNPFERELVRKELPEVVVPELPEDPAKYLDFLVQLNLFETASFSQEDGERTRQYQDEAKRVVAKQSYSSQEDYLKSLGMSAGVRPFDAFTLPRVAQLTQRSNQFNLRTVRYTEGDIDSIIASRQHFTLSFNLKDKFGDHGLIAAIILRKEREALFIDTWVMSCRVLGRGMEQFIINQISAMAGKAKADRIVGEYIPTPKNGIVKDLYANLGFTEEGGKWVLETRYFKPFNIYIDATH